LKIDLLPGGSATIIGLMSGTSADAIEAAVMEISGEEGGIRWELLQHVSMPWPAELRDAILQACRAEATIQQVTALNFRLGEDCAQAAISAAEAADLPLSRISAIASHGQTVWHQPEPFYIAGRATAGTMQIGEASVIAARTGCVTVADFRPADMAVGGQGAPLTPYADYLLFAHSSETRAIQNLGGIANVTLLPAGGGPDDVIAFDTGPANMVMDELVRLATAGEMQYDRDGELSSSGEPDRALLAELLQHPYFQLAPPKTTGREMFGASYCRALFVRGQSRKLSTPDLVATALALTVESIAIAYETHLLPHGEIDTVILGGGGTRNRSLVEQLCKRVAPARVTTHAEFGMPDEAKEAAAFALMGYCTLRGWPSNIRAATGATRDALLGKVSLPPCARGS
jgi:anhydro-N-acetylmuramic acid kinase